MYGRQNAMLKAGADGKAIITFLGCYTEIVECGSGYTTLCQDFTHCDPHTNVENFSIVGNESQNLT